MVLSVRQTTILDYVETRFQTGASFNLLVQAVAGSGKTRTLMEIMRRTPSRMAILFLAFGKTISEEIEEKAQALREEIGRDADVRTLNGMGFRIWRGRNPKAFLNDGKTDDIISEHIAKGDSKYPTPEYDHEVVRKLVALAKHAGLVPSSCRDLQGLTPDTPEQWASICDKYEVDSPTGIPMENNVRVARRVLMIGLTWSSYQNVLDFDDMMYMPMAHRVRPKFRFDLVLVDEAQDLSRTQRWIAGVMCKPNGGRVFVGDRAQAIFGFRGADSASMDNILVEFGCDELPLDVTFRCPRLVVAMAQQLVPGIQPCDDAADGLVETLETYDGRMFTGSDIVVCRNTAPLIQLAYALIGQRVAVQVLGRDIGTGLIKLVNQLVKSSRAKTVAQLVEAVEAWETKEVDDAAADDNARRVANIQDKAACIRAITGSMDPEWGVGRVAAVISSLFSDDNSDDKVTLMTLHKSKGLEAVNVWFLDEHLLPSSWATQPWQIEQETNLRYVGITRSQSCLRFIKTGGLVLPVEIPEAA